MNNELLKCHITSEVEKSRVEILSALLACQKIVLNSPVIDMKAPPPRGYVRMRFGIYVTKEHDEENAAVKYNIRKVKTVFHKCVSPV